MCLEGIEFNVDEGSLLRAFFVGVFLCCFELFVGSKVIL